MTDYGLVPPGPQRRDPRFRTIGGLWLLAAAALFALALAGCSTVPTGGSKGGSFCDNARPIRLTEKAVDALTHEQAVEAAAHNRFGAEACGWKP